MKTLPPIPAYQQFEELQKLTRLICEFLHPEMIILFGHYAGMNSCHILKGYEMLILTSGKCPVSFQELRQHLNQHFPPEKRLEKHFSTCILTTDFVRARTSTSHFLYDIRQNGILLYQKNGCKLSKRVRYKPTRTYQETEKNTALCLHLGNEFWEDALYHYEKENFRLAAFYLYQSTLQLFRGIIYAHFNFIPERDYDLPAAYSLIRHYSEEIANLSEQSPKFIQLLQHLQSYNYKARFNTMFQVNEQLCEQHLRLVGRIKTAAENFSRIKLDQLKKLQNPQPKQL